MLLSFISYTFFVSPSCYTYYIVLICMFVCICVSTFILLFVRPLSCTKHPTSTFPLSHQLETWKTPFFSVMDKIFSCTVTLLSHKVIRIFNSVVVLMTSIRVSILPNDTKGILHSKSLSVRP